METKKLVTGNYEMFNGGGILFAQNGDEALSGFLSLPQEREFRADYPDGTFQEFRGITVWNFSPNSEDQHAQIRITSPVLEGSIYDREGAD